METTAFLLNVVVLLVSLLLFKYLWNNKQLYLLSWQLPGPIALPLLGNALIFLRPNEEIFDVAAKVISSYPSPMRLWFGPKIAVVFSDPVQVEKVMSSSKFATKNDVYRFIKEFEGETLIAGSGPKWKRDRKLMSPLFAKKNTDRYFSTAVHQTKYLIEVLKAKIDKPTFNIQKYIHRCAADLVNESIIGQKKQAQQGNLDDFMRTCTRMYEIVHARIVKVWLQFDCIFNRTALGAEQAHGKKLIHGFMRQAYKEALNEHQNPNKTNPSFLDQMLDINDQIKDFANEQEFVEHLTTLYSASEDTISIVCSFSLLIFGIYQDIQEKIYDELKSIIGDYTKIELDHLDKLKYLEMCVKEIIRIFPIAPFIMRKASEDCIVDKWMIPKDCSVIVSIQNIHRNAKYWAKPNMYYPDHFLPENVARRHPYAFIPFSAGPRSCLGKQYAYMAVKTMLSMILLNYKITSDLTLEDIKLKCDISVRAKGEYYPIRLSKRI